MAHQQIDLIESADRCVRHLGRLRKRADDLKSKYTSGKKKDLEYVIGCADSNIGSLKAWTAAFHRGRQTSDQNIRASTNAVFDNIISCVADAKKVLDHRLGLHRWARKSKYDMTQVCT